MKIKTLVLTTALAITMSTSAFAFEEIDKIENLEGIIVPNDDTISSKDMLNFVNQEREIYQEDRPSLQITSANEGLEEAFLYQYIDEDKEISYIYENDQGKESISYSRGVKINSLDGGIGGRQYINASGIREITGNILLPKKTSVSSSDKDNPAIAYIYTGFTGGSAEVDMGLQYSIYNGWRPVMFYKNLMYTPETDEHKGHDQVIKLNMYISGQRLGFYGYPNYNGRVRLKVEGKAKYSDAKGNGPSKWLVSIIEKSPAISRSTKAKVLGTIATKGSDSSISGNFVTTFDKIKINGSVPSNGSFSAPEVEKAKITRSGNSVTIDVNTNYN